MDELWRTTVWIAVAGAIGGALNALRGDNVRLLPSTIVVAAGRTIVRPGLLLNVIVGSLASAAALRGFAGMTCLDEPARDIVAAVTAGLVIGALSASWLSSNADKQLLRAAASRAAAAPAAHPDTVATIETAPPHAVFETASRLVLQHRRWH